MGTRNLTVVALNGEYKVAQYGQWDGYPSGQGLVILDFISMQENVSNLKSALSKTRYLEPEGRDKEFMDSYNDNAPEWSNEPDNRTEEQKHWFRSYISRDLGGNILTQIVLSNDDEIILRNEIAFAGDSLSCEYAYVIDLDKNTFEIYEGFNKEQISEGRFVSDDGTLTKCGDYEPVKLIKTYILNNLPSQDDFLADLSEDDAA